MGYTSYGSFFSAQDVPQAVGWLAGEIVDGVTDCDKEYWQGNGGIGGTTAYYQLQGLLGELGYDGGAVSPSDGGPAGTFTSVRTRLDSMGGIGGSGFLPRDGSLPMTGHLETGTNYIRIGASTDPLYHLHIEASRASNPLGFVLNTSATGNGVYVGAGSTSSQYGLWVQDYSQYSTYLYVRGDGNIGVGNSAPATVLDITGTLNASGAVTFGSTLVNTGSGIFNGQLTVNQAASQSTVQIGNNGAYSSAIHWSAGTAWYMGVNSSDSYAFTINTASSFASPVFRITTAGAITFNNVYTFPTADGTTNYFLQTDGSGNVTWQAATGDITGSGTTNTITKFTGSATIGNSVITDDGTIVTIGGGTATPAPASRFNVLFDLTGTDPQGVNIIPKMTVGTTSFIGMTISPQTLNVVTHTSMIGLLVQPTSTSDVTITTNYGIMITKPSNATVGTSYSLYANAGSGTLVLAGDDISVTGDATITGTTTLNGVAYTWPASDAAGTLTSNGAGTLSWSAAGTGTVTGTGTTNYVPKWTGATALGNSLIQDDGTTVSVGGAGSGDIFEVYKNANAMYGAKVSNSTAGTASGAGVYASADAGTIYMRAYSSLYTTSGVHIADSGQVRADSALSAGLILAGATIGFYPADTLAMTIDASGNVGIGTSSPAKLLHLNNTGSGTALRLQDTSTTFDIDVITDTFRIVDRVNNLVPVTIQEGTPNNTLYLNSSGNVGIGTSSPNGLGNGGTNTTLEVFKTGGTGYLSLTSDVTTDNSVVGVLNWGTTGASTGKSSASIQIDLEGVGTTNASGNMRFYTRNGATFGERMAITSAGNVGIGGTPSYLLHIKGSSPSLGIEGTSGNAWRLETSATGNVFNLTETGVGSAISVDAGSSSGGTNIKIDASGNVGIGTSSPTVPLNVVGGIQANGGTIWATSSATPSSGYVIQMSHDGSAGYLDSSYYTGGFTPLILRTSNTARLTIASGGAVSVANEFTVNTSVFHVDGITANVGIGTAAPLSRLHITGSNSYAGGGLLLGSAGVSSGYIWTTDNLYIKPNSTSGTVSGIVAIQNFSDVTQIYLNTNGSSYFTGGDVAIGVSSVTSIGDGGDPRILVVHSGTSTNGGMINLTHSLTASGTTSGGISWGNLGLSNSDKRLAGIYVAKMDALTTGGTGDIIFYNWNAGTGAESARITSAGNVGIAMTPARTLDVTGTFGATGAVTLGSTLTISSGAITQTGPDNTYHYMVAGDGLGTSYTGISIRDSSSIEWGGLVGRNDLGFVRLWAGGSAGTPTGTYYDQNGSDHDFKADELGVADFSIGNTNTGTSAYTTMSWLQGGATVAMAYALNTYTAGVNQYATNGFVIESVTGYELRLSAQGTNPIEFWANGQQKFFMDSSAMGIYKNAYTSVTTDGVWFQYTSFNQASVTHATNACWYINQNSTGPVINLYDGGSLVYTLIDGGDVEMTGNLKIGQISTPLSTLHVYDAANGTTSGIRLENNSGSDWGMGELVFNNTWSLYDYTAADGRINVKSDGDVGIGTLTPTYRLHVAKNTLGFVVNIENSRGAVPTPPATMDLLRLSYSGVAVNDAVNTVIAYVDNGTLRMRMYANGAIYNNGTYGTISDRRLKENIVSVRSYWDDFLSLGYKKFNMIDKPEINKFGLIAQEVEDVFPSLVNIMDGGYKTVNTSIIHEIGMSVLQENMKRTMKNKKDIDILREELEASVQDSLALKRRIEVLEAV